MFYSEDSLDLSFKEELKLLWMLICFAVPVAITALSEMAMTAASAAFAASSSESPLAFNEAANDVTVSM
mgnify:CR=1 FL=1